MSILFASEDREPAAYNADFSISPQARGVLIYINYTAEGGATATLDFKIQYRDDAEDAWDDLAGASLAQFTGVAESDLMLYPGIVAVANRAVSIGVPGRLRAVATVGTDNLTFSAGFQELT